MADEKEINALELRKHFGETLDQVHVQKQTFIITKNGRPTAVLLDIGVYQTLLQQPPSVPGLSAAAAASPPPAPAPPPAPKEEDRFIEIYTRERIEEFMKEDRMTPPPPDPAAA